MLVYDYAKWSATVQHVTLQVNNEFLPHAAQKPSWARWTAKNSLFCIPSVLIGVLTVVTWVGINDMSYMRNPPDQLNALFQLQDQLYDVGARNFVFLTIPPFDRPPWGIPCSPLLHLLAALGQERDPNGINE